eukprot:5750662-Alexandrium_andersonii.AAC.1
MRKTSQQFEADQRLYERFGTEMAVVNRRLSWLLVIRDKMQSDLKHMIDAMEPAAGQSIDGISTSDESRSLARAGPCPGFQSLKTLQEMFTDKVMFRSCKSMDDIKKLQQESVQPRKKQLNTLISSCNAA